MKRTIETIFALVFMCSTSSISHAQSDVSPQPFIDVSVPGATVSVAIILTYSQINEIQAFKFTLTYPNLLLTFSKVSTTSTLTAGWLVSGQENLGKVTIVGAIIGDPIPPGITTSGTLINVEFTVDNQVGTGNVVLSDFIDDIAGSTTNLTHGAVNNATPVELTTFSAAISNQAVSLIWTTASESNNFGFDVERSLDAAHFTKIGFVKGSGNSQVLQKYTFSDENVNMASKAYFYRLKQIDTDGAFEYSPTLEVALATPELFALQQNYPNPFNPATTISYELPEASSVILTIYNMKGQVIRTLVNGQMPAGFHNVVWNGKNDSGQDAASGSYLYQLKTDGFSDIKRLTLLR
jgi:hypothetical protein